MNKEIDPRKPVSLNVNLKNLYSFDFGKLTFTAESDVFNLSRVVYAPADFDQNLNFDLVLDPKTLEGSHDIYFKAVDGKGVVYMTQTKTFNVMKYSDIQEVVEPRNGFLIYGDRITETNAGNEIATKTITREVSVFVKFFTSFVPELSSTERNANDKYSVSWVLALNPGEVKTVEYKTDYLTPLLILILVIAIIVILYVWVISPVSITKRVVTLHSRKGNIAIMKVLINIRNNRRLPLHNLSVMDKVPKTIRAPTEFGLERPSTTDVQEEGTRFVWHVPTLNPVKRKFILTK